MHARSIERCRLVGMDTVCTILVQTKRKMSACNLSKKVAPNHWLYESASKTLTDETIKERLEGNEWKKVSLSISTVVILLISVQRDDICCLHGLNWDLLCVGAD